MIEYKIKEGTEDTIIKTGDVVEFNINDIDTDMAYLEKNKKEIVAQIGVQKATKENVAGTHPHIADMSNEDLTAAYLYRQATGYITVAEEKLAEINKQLEDYAAEKVEITKQTGLQPSIFMNENETKPAEEVTPEVTHETTPAPEATPEVAPEATPEVTPEA